MKRNLNRCLLLSILIIITSLSSSVFAESNGAVSGKYRGIDWVITNEGNLLLGKAGEIQVFDRETDPFEGMYELPPWNEYSASIKKISISGNIEAKGSMEYLFADCYYATEIDLSGFDTSEVTSFEGMFYWCYKVESINISGFNTAKVRSMKDMFRECYSLSAIDVSSFDTSSVQLMSHMFQNCSSLSELDLRVFDTSNVKYMDWMFASCSSLTSLNTESFRTGNVRDMTSMFSCCNSLEELHVENFDTSSVTSMREMFMGCCSLHEIDLDNFETSRVNNMNRMFDSCMNALIDTSSFDTSQVTDMSSMFSGCYAFNIVDISNFDMSNVVDAEGMFGGDNIKKMTPPVNLTIDVALPNALYPFCNNKTLKLPKYLEESNTEMVDYPLNNGKHVYSTWEKTEWGKQIQHCLYCGNIKEQDIPPEELDDSDYYVIGKDTNNFEHTTDDFFNIKRIIFRKESNNSKALEKREYDVTISPEEYDYLASMWSRLLQANISYPFTSDCKEISNKLKHIVNAKEVFNDKDAFVELSDSEEYKCTTKYYKQLITGASYLEKMRIKSEITTNWGGSCFGIELASILASEGHLGNIFESDSFYSLGLPKDNKKNLRDVINFYQLFQNRSECNYSCATFNDNPLLEPLPQSKSEKNFLKMLVREAKKSKLLRKPFILAYQAEKSSGHAVVVCGYSFDESKQEHVIKIYDCNDYNHFQNNHNSTGGDAKYREFRVSNDYSSFSYVDANREVEGTGDLSGKYQHMYIYDIDTISKIPSISSTRGVRMAESSREMTHNRDSNNLHITVPAYKNCTIINKEGEHLSYNGNHYYGNMHIINARVFGEPEAQIEFEIEYSDAIMITHLLGNDFSASAEINGNYYSAETSHADTIILSNSGVSVKDDDNGFFDYCITQGHRGDAIDGISITGNVQGFVQTYFDEKLKVELENSNEYIGVSVFTEEGVNHTFVEENVNEIEVSAIGSDIQIKKSIVKKSINDYRICEIAPQKYTGRPITPAFEVSDGYKTLIEDTDYTVAYENNINTGIASVYIRGIGNYCDVATAWFEITDDSEETYQYNDLKYNGVNFHVYGSWNIIKYATELCVGKKTRKCILCGHIDTASISLLPPTLPRVKISKIKVSKKSAKVKWAKISKKNRRKIKKIQIQYSTDRRFKTGVKTKTSSARKTSKRIRLKKGKKYYIRIRALTGNHISKWSTVKSVKIK